MNKKWMTLILLILGAMIASGCAISNEGMMAYNDAKDTFQKATLAGAKKCAPYQYAKAEAYLALADEEVAEKDEWGGGDFYYAVKMVKEKSLEALKLTPCEKPPPPAPTVSLSASPATIEQSQCTTLTWSSANASNVAIDQGIGRVDLNGSRQICPMSTTQYTITAQGMGGSQTAATTVVVNPPPSPPPAPKVIDKMTLHVLFDFDKSTLKPSSVDELQKAVAFVKKYPGANIRLDGYTDSIGTDAYNTKLSERRAAAVRDYLIKEAGVDSSKITAVGHGKADPVADNKTAEGRAENRRVEVSILSD